jgi:hypothetical protein
VLVFATAGGVAFRGGGPQAGGIAHHQTRSDVAHACAGARGDDRPLIDFQGELIRCAGDIRIKLLLQPTTKAGAGGSHYTPRHWLPPPARPEDELPRRRTDAADELCETRARARID